MLRFYRIFLLVILSFAELQTYAQQDSNTKGGDASFNSTDTLHSTAVTTTKLDSSKYVAGLEWLVPPNASDSESLQLYQQYLRVHPFSIRAKFMLGIKHCHLHQYPEAIAVMEEIAKDSFYDTDALISLAYAYNMLGQSQYAKEYNLKALETANQHIKKDSSSARYYFLRGYINTCLNNYRTVLQDYDKSISLNMTDKNVYYWRGLARIALNQSSLGCDDLYLALKMGYGETASNQLCYRCAELCKRYNLEKHRSGSSKRGKK